MSGDSFGDPLIESYRPKRTEPRDAEHNEPEAWPIGERGGHPAATPLGIAPAAAIRATARTRTQSGTQTGAQTGALSGALSGAFAGALAGVLATVLATSMGWGGPGGAESAASERSGVRNDSLVASEAGIGDDRLLQAVRATRPAVVTIWNLQHARRSLTSPVRLEPVTSGSGVIFDDRGYVATNSHVIENARSIEVVFLDGRRAEAVLVHSDRAYDIAIIKLPDGIELPAVAPLADSSMLEPGMGVVAIGSPLGTEYQNTVTSGIIAGLNRNITTQSFDIFTWRTFEQDINATPLIQTDAAINRGNSGGPLIDLSGRVVGLNTAVLRRREGAEIEGLGFAVPSNVVQTLADEWIDGEQRASLGVGFRTIDPDFARISGMSRGSGALVVEVPAGGAGARAGLRAGDRIVAIDGIALDLDHALTDLMWRYRAGDRVRLTVEREETITELDVLLDAWSGGPG